MFEALLEGGGMTRVFVLLLMASWGLVPSPAEACSCRDSPLHQRYAKAGAVVRARIIDREIQAASGLPDSQMLVADGYVGMGGKFAQLRYTVTETFKQGDLPEFFRESLDSAACANGFTPGQEYVVFVEQDRHGFMGRCLGTFRTDDGDAAAKINSVRQLATLYKPTDADGALLNCEGAQRTKDIRRACARRYWGHGEVAKQGECRGAGCDAIILTADNESESYRALIEKLQSRDTGGQWWARYAENARTPRFGCLRFRRSQSADRLLVCSIDDEAFCGDAGCPVYFLRAIPGAPVKVDQAHAVTYYTPGREELDGGRAYFGVVYSDGREAVYLWQGDALASGEQKTGWKSWFADWF